MEEIRDLEIKLHRKGYDTPVFLGSGAFSRVYRIRNQVKGSFWACKISEINPMAERETELLGELSHPLFPRYECHWMEDGMLYLVMEYISGSSLQKLVEQRGAFSKQQTVRIGMELASGLEFLHERSNPIIFRDIKPENVMIREDGRVKLVDVGCACRLEGDVGKNMAGSRGYAPPEQFSTDESPGRESDVYALGKLLQFLLTGGERNKEEKEQSIRNRKWREMSKGLERVLQQAVQEERQKRIPDMRTFQQKLAKYHQGVRYAAGQALYFPNTVREDGEFYYIENVRKGF